jgi:parvulin-like peptidyl-prolyl isomerase
MFRSVLLVIILTQFALAQAGAPPQAPGQPATPSPAPQQPATPEDHSHHGMPATPAPAEAAAPKKPVAATAPVITLNGFCEAPSAAAPAAKPPTQNCKKVITKGEFERILSAAVPPNRRSEVLANPQFLQQVARQYAEIMVMANEAKKRGLQRRPSTQELMRISQMQVLAQGLMQELNEKATPTPAEIDNYYNENKAAFEEVIVRRLMLPKPAAPAAPAASGSEAKPGEPAAPAAAAPPPAPDEAAQKAYAEKAGQRAAKGEDLDKIQSDAFLYYKSTQAPPTTVLGPRRRGTLPPDHDLAVFALKPGEVTQWFETPNGWYLYKVESKRMLPLGEVREEITRRIQPQKFNDSRAAITNSVRPDFNPDYFGGAPASSPAGTPPGALEGRRPGPGAHRPAPQAGSPPPAQPATQPK